MSVLRTDMAVIAERSAKMKYVVLLLLVVQALIAKDELRSWLRNGAPVANTESRKSVEGFGAAMLITADADWEKKWNTPASEAPQFTEIEKLKRGERAWVLIFFANPKPDASAWIDVECDIKITRPNGNITENKGLKAMRTQLKGPATNTYLAEPVLGFVGEDSDPLGDWVFEVTVRDLNRKVSIPVKAKFALLPK